MELTAKLYQAKRLGEIVKTVGEGLGVFVDSFSSKRNWSSGYTTITEMQHELTELKRQMGASERRQFDQLYEEWRCPKKDASRQSS